MDKCSKCNKNKHILLNCKCGGNYCMKHYKMENHSCEYNLKEENKKRIIKNNPTIINEKIEKI